MCYMCYFFKKIVERDREFQSKGQNFFYNELQCMQNENRKTSFAIDKCSLSTALTCRNVHFVICMSSKVNVYQCAA